MPKVCSSLTHRHSFHLVVYIDFLYRDYRGLYFANYRDQIASRDAWMWSLKESEISRKHEGEVLVARKFPLKSDRLLSLKTH